MKKINEYLSAKINKNKSDDLNTTLVDLDTLLNSIGIAYNGTHVMHDNTIWRSYAYSSDLFDILEDAYHDKSVATNLQKKLRNQYEECSNKTVTIDFNKDNLERYCYQQLELKVHERVDGEYKEICNFCIYNKNDGDKDSFCVVIYKNDTPERMQKSLSYINFLISSIFK